MLKDALEANIKQAIEPNTPVTTIMLKHAAAIIKIFSMNQDGKKSMEKARGPTANREMAEFAEKRLEQSNKLDVKMSTRTVHGTRINENMSAALTETREHGRSGGCQRTNDGMQKQ